MSLKKSKKDKPNEVGRPSVINQSVLLKLEEAFAMGCTDKEACFFAGISPSTLYLYCNEEPEFSERKETLKQNPILKARKTVYDDLSDSKTAQWYLERKCKDEFSQRQEVKAQIVENLEEAAEKIKKALE